MGLCTCGCGQRTNRYRDNNRKLGIRKGDYVRFVKGHASRIYKPAWNKKSYKCITVNGKVIRLHRYLMEQKVGRKLRSNEHVHHINGNFTDNRIENLTILSASEHKKHHNPEANKPDLICEQCKIKFRAKRRKGNGKIGLIQWVTRRFCSYKCTYKWRKKNKWRRDSIK